MPIPAQYVHPILAKLGSVKERNPVIDFERSEGSYFMDLASGMTYLDCDALNGTLPLGYGHPAYTHRDIEAGWKAPPPYKLPHTDVYSSEYATFLSTFAKIIPDRFKSLALTDSPESALWHCLKIAKDRKSKDYTGWFIYIEAETLAMPKGPEFGDLWMPLLYPAVRFPVPADQEDREKKSLAEFSELKTPAEGDGPNDKDVANIDAIVVQPISASDYDVYRPVYLQRLRKIADDFDALLIFDETKSSFGATGHWWGFQYYDVEPDMFAFGNRSQVSGIAATERAGKFPEIRNSCSYHDMDSCLHIIQAIQKDNIIENTKNVGEYLIARLRQAEAISALISNVRGLGTLVAFDLPDSITRDKVLARLNKDVLVSGCGKRSIKFQPALTFSKEDVDTIIDRLRKALKL
jgi:L-lysine 6-transaminase